MSYELKAPKHHHRTGEDLFDELFTKEAYVTGARAPDLVESEHAGIPYATRRKAYLRYVHEKSKEGHTPLGKALLTGAGIGAGAGALIAQSGSRGVGAVAGALGGGLVGAIAKVSDDAEINAARSAVRGGKGVVDEMLAGRMAHRHAMERAQDRSERRANTLMLANALSKPRTVNNYSTRVNAISVRNNVRSSNTNIVKVGSAAVGGLLGGAVGGGLGYASSDKNKMRNTLLGAGAGAAIGAGIGFKPSVKGGGKASSGFKVYKGKNQLLYQNGKVYASSLSDKGEVINIRRVRGVSDKVKERLRKARGNMVQFDARKEFTADGLNFILSGVKV